MKHQWIAPARRRGMFLRGFLRQSHFKSLSSTKVSATLSHKAIYVDPRSCSSSARDVLRLHIYRVRTGRTSNFKLQESQILYSKPSEGYEERRRSMLVFAILTRAILREGTLQYSFNDFSCRVRFMLSASKFLKVSTSFELADCRGCGSELGAPLHFNATSDM